MFHRLICVSSLIGLVVSCIGLVGTVPTKLVRTIPMKLLGTVPTKLVGTDYLILILKLYPFVASRNSTLLSLIIRKM